MRDEGDGRREGGGRSRRMVVKKTEVVVGAADYEDETKAAVRRLFEAWKRALDATIEVPDREPAINALSSVPRKEWEGERIERKRKRASARACARVKGREARGERERIEGEDRGGRIEKRAR